MATDKRGHLNESANAGKLSSGKMQNKLASSAPHAKSALENENTP